MKKKPTPKGCIKGCLTSVLICLALFLGLALFMDTEPPAITTANQKVEYGTKLAYKDFVSATDNESENIILEILNTEMTGLVINNEEEYLLCEEPGTYELQITATDENENQAADTVTIEVTDTQPPVITKIQEDYVIGYNESVDLFSKTEGIQLEIEEHSDYEVTFTGLKPVVNEIENGAVGTEPVELYIAGEKENEIKIGKLGRYIAEFAVTDSHGNVTTEKAIITVQDKTGPVVECALSIYELSDSAKNNDYRRQLKAMDEIDGNLSALIEIDDSEVKYGIPGEYKVHTHIADKNGNATTESFPVIIKDKTPPDIKLSKSSFTLTVGDDAPDYENIAFAHDGIDGNVTSLIQIDDSKVNYEKAGTYKVRFTATDQNGNTSYKDATVKIKKASTPTRGGVTGSITDSGRQVLITKTGECYHTHKCGRGTYFWVSYEIAIARGLRACKKCY